MSNLTKIEGFATGQPLVFFVNGKKVKEKNQASPPALETTKNKHFIATTTDLLITLLYIKVICNTIR